MKGWAAEKHSDKNKNHGFGIAARHAETCDAPKFKEMEMDS